MVVASEASGEGKHHLGNKMILLKAKKDKNQFGGR